MMMSLQACCCQPEGIKQVPLSHLFSLLRFFLLQRLFWTGF
jgi:hypothetical protein